MLLLLVIHYIFLIFPAFPCVVSLSLVFQLNIEILYRSYWCYESFRYLTFSIFQLQIVELIDDISLCDIYIDLPWS